MKPTFDSKDIQALKDQLLAPRKITLISHVSPDGDAVGSTLALSKVLRLLGHDTRVVYPSYYPDSFVVLHGIDDTIIARTEAEKAIAAIESAEMIFCMDFNEPKRVEGLSDHLERARAFKVLIDHHLHPSPFADITFSYPEMSSTCLLLYHLLEELGWMSYVDQDVAEAIYWGMMTDTGNFSYNSEDPDIYTTISALLEKGMRKDFLTAAVQRGFSVDRIRLNAHAIMNNMRVFPEYKTAIITLTNREKLEYNYKVGDTEGLVNVPLEAKDIEFSVFIFEVNNMTKISLRSKGEFPTNVFARNFFNGGGHKNASGAEVYDSLSNTYDLVLKALKVMHP
ncbi:bifunctional oligoribonuclease/PAP phosphatase NrnA [Porphyromonas sp.]|uniref:DHH family phosphoesterase n=1 Tax=Porphyromonas sp. TaxID=1924944 RepID=UPI0026DCA830|nr:DHH family phosphoesterase [Porphyromonas sp.]MDO4695776.1 DHH family phosphoesterase [Porphyromonas sp.]MDO4771545.1 DHH family phosphoesterase [Porphyromonas sp.]